MTEPINYSPDIGTLARHALYRELLAVGMSECKALATAGKLEIRVRDERGETDLPSRRVPDTHNLHTPFGTFRVRTTTKIS